MTTSIPLSPKKEEKTFYSKSLKTFKNCVFTTTFNCTVLQMKQLVFMIRVHVLLNMYLNFVSSEIILPTYFEIQGFERHCGLT